MKKMKNEAEGQKHFGKISIVQLEIREARGRVHRGSKLWWRLDVSMRLFAVPLRLL